MNIPPKKKELDPAKTHDRGYSAASYGDTEMAERAAAHARELTALGVPDPITVDFSDDKQAKAYHEGIDRAQRNLEAAGLFVAAKEREKMGKRPLADDVVAPTDKSKKFKIVDLAAEDADEPTTMGPNVTAQQKEGEKKKGVSPTASSGMSNREIIDAPVTKSTAGSLKELIDNRSRISKPHASDECDRDFLVSSWDASSCQTQGCDKAVTWHMTHCCRRCKETTGRVCGQWCHGIQWTRGLTEGHLTERIIDVESNWYGPRPGGSSGSAAAAATRP